MLFSVIVPIYKIEKYLARCIDSVLSQSFADFELILVDDGSPDSCGEICDAYAQKDKRIKVIHKENGGLVSARQAGIRIASGAYIMNLDGDDALCPNALESAWKIIEDTQAEVVSFSYRLYVNEQIGDVVDDLLDEGLYEGQQIREKIEHKLLSDRNMQHLFYFSWGRAIKRELALKHQLPIDTSITMGEDFCCTIPCLLDAQRVYMSKIPIALYTIRNDSMSNGIKTEQIDKVAKAMDYLRSLTIKMPEDFEEQLDRYSCFMCFAILAAAAEGNHFRSVKALKDLILGSLHQEEIQKAVFQKITPKSRIAINLMKKQQIGLAFGFLYLCKELKR